MTATDTTMPGSGRLLTVDELVVEFRVGKTWQRAVDGISFTVEAGEIVGLVGESGSGKTAAGLALLGLHDTAWSRSSARSIQLAGRELTTLSKRDLQRARGAEIAMIFQEPMSSLNPVYTVGEQIAETVRQHRKLSRRASWKKAVEALDTVGIPGAAARARSYPHEFSGGMRQRVMIAMAIACEPKILIADEPTTALDVTVQAQVLDLLDTMRRDLGLSVVLVTHDLGVVSQVCDRVLVMYAGQIVEGASRDDIFGRPGHPYAEGLLASMPQQRLLGGELATIPGRAPQLGAFPDGCRLHPRCPYAIEACTIGVIGSVRADAGIHTSACICTDELALEGLA